jgi:uncharacterized peroxidase-related enzyme
MPWIATVPAAEAAGTLKDAYDWQAARLGEPTEFTQLGSLYPDLVLERLRLYKVVDATPSRLSAEERALAALATSDLNGTVHCASGLRVRLGELGVDSGVVEAIDADAAVAAAGAATPRLRAILAYAVRLTRVPRDISVDDIEALRAVGLDDLDILDLNNLVAYYNYINRVANGLGLRTPIESRQHALAAVPG